MATGKPDRTTSHGILEQAVLSITPGLDVDLEAAYATAQRIFAITPGFRYMVLSRELGRPDTDLQLVRGY